MPLWPRDRWRRAAATLCLAIFAATALPSLARERAPETVHAAALPPEARATLALIGAGGPFPYERDGVAFGNREHLLPAKPHGYYREYTVPTPRARTRAARRIVCGGAVATLSECYYSDDHYRSFRKIQP
ncbi:MAG TPA: ribonuclease domain-containing protein [Casimicrobiaceae bacterium]|nr:ribonuclease domain-containing protein [Casimicrobiaceae bacterium]